MKKRVVVTGLGAVTPIGNNVSSMWENMMKGTNGIGMISLFDTATSKVKVAAEVKQLDPSKYLDERSAAKLDRVIVLGIMAASEAYEDAGLTSASVDPYRFGTFVTSGIGGLNSIWAESQVAISRGLDRVSPHFITNAIINLIGGNISMRFKAKGPNLPVVTACSASTNSIGEAFRYIRDGYLDVAFAGGSESSINALGIAGFAVMRALHSGDNPAQASMPFDKKRSGFVMGEGAGVLILEEYDHAKARGAKIYAELVGYGSTSDAFHVTAPDETAEGISKCMELALKDANLQPQDIDYINAHGTSTPLNDRIETLGIKKVFGPHAYALNVSSTKGMTGHMLGATGAVESIACILALVNQIVPPTITTNELGPECDLNYTLSKPVNRKVNYALNINLGFGGQNAALIFKR
ncbi:MAG: 3-oxoacyl-[acyl-carrier-protein] synthase 2 [Bacillota bacterium]|jgi:3-oxoacyl-[acyl-carrier-protein] synthase II